MYNMRAYRVVNSSTKKRIYALIFFHNQHYRYVNIHVNIHNTYIITYLLLNLLINKSNQFKHLPAIFESYATPVPQTPLSRAAATSPAQRVPWLLNQSSVYLGYGYGSLELKS